MLNYFDEYFYFQLEQQLKDAIEQKNLLSIEFQTYRETRDMFSNTTNEVSVHYFDHFQKFTNKSDITGQTWVYYIIFSTNNDRTLQRSEEMKNLQENVSKLESTNAALQKSLQNSNSKQVQLWDNIGLIARDVRSELGKLCSMLPGHPEGTREIRVSH